MEIGSTRKTEWIVHLEGFITNAKTAAANPELHERPRVPCLVHEGRELIHSLYVDLSKLEDGRLGVFGLCEQNAFIFIIRMLSERSREGHGVLWSSRSVTDHLREWFFLQLFYVVHSTASFKA